MTNTTFTSPTTIMIDDSPYIIAPIPTDDRACLRLMLELQRDAAAYLTECAAHDLEGEYSLDADIPLTQWDYSGDRDDYNPAASALLNAITMTLTAHEYESPRDALINLITASDSNFCIDAMTADFGSPLLALIEDPDFE